MKEKAPRHTPEIPKLDLTLANETVNALVDARLKKVRPLKPIDYDLDAIQPDLIVPDLRQAINVWVNLLHPAFNYLHFYSIFLTIII